MHSTGFQPTPRHEVQQHLMFALERNRKERPFFLTLGIMVLLVWSVGCTPLQEATATDWGLSEVEVHSKWVKGGVYTHCRLHAALGSQGVVIGCRPIGSLGFVVFCAVVSQTTGKVRIV